VVGIVSESTSMTRDNKIPTWKVFMIIGIVTMIVPLAIFGICYITTGGYEGESGFGLIGGIFLGVPVFLVGCFLVGWSWVLKGKK
jgi:uncharacterized membrane protein